MATEGSIKEDVEGWLSSSSTDQAADYATKGRKHQRLTDDELTAAWLFAFKCMAEDLRDKHRLDEYSDLRSEMTLRGREPPYQLVRAEFDKCIAETVASIEQIERENPVKFDQLKREIEDELIGYKATRDRTKS